MHFQCDGLNTAVSTIDGMNEGICQLDRVQNVNYAIDASLT